MRGRVRRGAVAAVAALVLAAPAGCGGTSAAQRAQAQAHQACAAAASSGASSTDAVVHAHQAAGLDPRWQPLAQAFGTVGVLRQSLGSDLGAGEDDGTGGAALTTIGTDCRSLGVAVDVSAPQTADPVGDLGLQQP